MDGAHALELDETAFDRCKTLGQRFRRASGEAGAANDAIGTLGRVSERRPLHELISLSVARNPTPESPRVKRTSSKRTSPTSEPSRANSCLVENDLALSIDSHEHRRLMIVLVD